MESQGGLLRAEAGAQAQSREKQLVLGFQGLCRATESVCVGGGGVFAGVCFNFFLVILLVLQIILLRKYIKNREIGVMSPQPS